MSAWLLSLGAVKPDRELLPKCELDREGPHVSGRQREHVPRFAYLGTEERIYRFLGSRRLPAARRTSALELTQQVRMPFHRKLDQHFPLRIHASW